MQGWDERSPRTAASRCSKVQPERPGAAPLFRRLRTYASVSFLSGRARGRLWHHRQGFRGVERTESVHQCHVVCTDGLLLQQSSHVTQRISRLSGTSRMKTLEYSIRAHLHNAVPPNLKLGWWQQVADRRNSLSGSGLRLSIYPCDGAVLHTPATSHFASICSHASLWTAGQSIEAW
jgi:hypothetical protein